MFRYHCDGTIHFKAIFDALKPDYKNNRTRSISLAVLFLTLNFNTLHRKKKNNKKNGMSFTHGDSKKSLLKFFFFFQFNDGEPDKLFIFHRVVVKIYIHKYALR